MTGSIEPHFSDDAAGLGKAAAKFIDTIGDGVATVANAIYPFDAKKIVRIAKAEAQAERIKIVGKAETEVEASRILARTSKRFLIEQYNKQVNLENTLAKTMESLKNVPDDIVSDNKLTNDWVARFLEIAQDISDDDVQNILAGIFTKEIVEPGNVGRRGLDLLRSLEKQELELFARFTAFSSNIGLYSMGPMRAGHLRKYGFGVPEYRILAELGLVDFSQDVSIHTETTEHGTEFIGYHTREIRLISVPARKIELPIVPLTKVGEQLYSFMLPYVSGFDTATYFDELKSYLERLNITVTIKELN